jgi:hypothetical protein
MPRQACLQPVNCPLVSTVRHAGDHIPENGHDGTVSQRIAPSDGQTLIVLREGMQRAQIPKRLVIQTRLGGRQSLRDPPHLGIRYTLCHAVRFVKPTQGGLVEQPEGPGHGQGGPIGGFDAPSDERSWR